MWLQKGLCRAPSQSLVACRPHHMSIPGATAPTCDPGAISTPTKNTKPPHTPKTPENGDKNAPHRASPKQSPHTPKQPTVASFPSPLTPISAKYAAGLLPITYHEDKDTKERVWKVLLLIEWRSLEARKCVHPLAGKKEKIDGDNPIKTGVREFHEETQGVFQGFGELEQNVQANAAQHNLYTYFPESKMFLFLTYVPHAEDANARFQASKAAAGDGQSAEDLSQCELFWYPLEDFLRLQGRMTYRHEDVDVAPSICAAKWFNRGHFLRAIARFKTITEERLAKNASPLYIPISGETDAAVDLLAQALGGTAIGVQTPIKKMEIEIVQTASSAPTNPDPQPEPVTIGVVEVVEAKLP